LSEFDVDVCSKGHAEIVYEDWTCPVCELIDEHGRELDELRDDHSDAIVALEDEINSLKETIQELESA